MIGTKNVQISEENGSEISGYVCVFVLCVSVNVWFVEGMCDVMQACVLVIVWSSQTCYRGCTTYLGCNITRFFLVK